MLGRSGMRGRLLLLSLVAGVLALLPGVAAADRWASEPPGPQTWVVTTDDEVALRAEPTVASERLAAVRADTPLRVLGDAGDWVHVFEPRSGQTAYVRGDLLAPTDRPSVYIYMAPPPISDELETIAVVTQDRPLYYYPTPNERAQAMKLDAGERENIVGALTGDDGNTWFQTQDGYFLPQDGLFLASDPDAFDGRWLDVSLSGAARVVAYDGGAPVRSFYAIKGTTHFPTQPGLWSIIRRVQDETMDSATVGIPRNAPNGYYLQHVLYTQYFTPDGASLHYNWWSSAWGSAGSHGCLGLSLADSQWLWDWASIGTPVLIHP
jgi:lipoprotein-anchoring transpeptidase ErfK/SrfK